MQYTAIFTAVKMTILYFSSFAQNMDFGYTLEPPQNNESKNKKIMYTPVNPNFTILKWGVIGSTLHEHVSVIEDRQDNGTQILLWKLKREP